MAGCLRVSGFEVDTAADGLQAMVRLTEKKPEVVLLDIRMPRFDGRKTISAIRSNPDYRDLKLFAVSGTRPEEMHINVGPGWRRPLVPEATQSESLTRSTSRRAAYRTRTSVARDDQAKWGRRATNPRIGNTCPQDWDLFVAAKERGPPEHEGPRSVLLQPVIP